LTTVRHGGSILVAEFVYNFVLRSMAAMRLNDFAVINAHRLFSSHKIFHRNFSDLRATRLVLSSVSGLLRGNRRENV